MDPERFVQPQQNQCHDLVDIVMENNTIMWCMDGSYDRKCVPTVSGTGLVAHCTKTNNMTVGIFSVSRMTQDYTVVTSVTLCNPQPTNHCAYSK